MSLKPEDELIAELTRGLPVGPSVLRGIGDDCAVVGAPARGRVLVLKTDCVVGGIHFTATAEAAKVGWKAIMRTASDFAAMGAAPEHALITLCLPASTSMAWVRQLYKGMRKAMDAIGACIVGGETSRSHADLVITVAMTGTVPARKWIARNTASPGHLLYVTGVLGGSIRGHHLSFFPRLAEGQWLASKIRPTAMMDLSDGLAKDLPRMAKTGGWEIDLAALPLRTGCTAIQGATDGEDYELLFAVEKAKSSLLERTWPGKFPKTKLTKIGQLAERKIRTGLPQGGWDHFRAEP